MRMGLEHSDLSESFEILRVYYVGGVLFFVCQYQQKLYSLDFKVVYSSFKPEVGIYAGGKRLVDVMSICEFEREFCGDRLPDYDRCKDWVRKGFFDCGRLGHPIYASG